MICNLCGTNAASIHLTEIVNTQMVEIHLCESCAEEKGTEFKTHFNVTDLLAGLGEPDLPENLARKAEAIRCAGCGMGYVDFTKNGRLGCAQCYESFSRYLNPLIKRIQRSSQHMGKWPSKVPPEAQGRHELRMLQEKLRKSVQKEAFEEAAAIRDQIKTVMDKTKKSKRAKHE